MRHNTWKSSASWISSETVERGLESTGWRLDAGEAEAITFASTRFRSEFLLQDDLRARTVAMRLGLRIGGSSGVLIAARDHHLIPTVKAPLDELMRAGPFLTASLYRQVLMSVAESVDN